MNLFKILMVLIFTASIAACGGSDTAANDAVDDPDNTAPLSGDAVWNTSNWDEKNWK